MSAMIQNLKSLNDLVDLAPTLDHATAHEVYYPSGDASRFRVIKNDATNREVCTISDRYSILQHNDALNLILTGIEAAGITGGGVLRNYHNNSYRDWETDRKSTRLNSSHRSLSRMPSSA